MWRGTAIRLSCAGRDQGEAGPLLGQHDRIERSWRPLTAAVGPARKGSDPGTLVQRCPQDSVRGRRRANRGFIRVGASFST